MYRSFAQSHKWPLKLIPLILIVALVVSIIGPGEAQADPGWYNSSWDYRKKVTINSDNVTGSSNLLFFPVLISVTDADLASDARNDGWDILFTASDETTKLQHEIESFNGTTGNLKAWVEIPSLSPLTNTEIYMYYGNSGVTSSSENVTGTWDGADYKMVQHLEESSGGADAIIDSTPYDNDGSDDNTLTYSATGQIDGAIGFNGSDDYIQVDDSASLSTTDNITVEAWVKGSSQAYKVFAAHCDAGTNQLSWKFYTAADTKMRIDISDDGTYDSGHRKRYDSSIDAFDNNWHYVAFTFGPTLNIYIDGQKDTNPTKVYDDAITSLHNSTADVLIGAFLNSGTPAQFFNGTIDEVRVSATARSADWIKTSFNNQNNPGDFLNFGPEIGAPSVTTGAASFIEETSATVNGTLTDDGGEACEYRFEYDDDAPGVPYDYATTWTGSITSGQQFSASLSSLDEGTVYYYRAQVRNNAGTASGSGQSFLTKPLEPSGFTATTASSSQINLSWTKGVGAQRTKIMRKEGSYPTHVNDGDEVYFDTGTSTPDTGLMPSTTYFYSAWSEVTGSQQWSDNPAQANATTTSGAPTVIGGLVLPVNKATVLAPWIFLGVVLSLAIVRTVFYLRKKRRLRTPVH